MKVSELLEAGFTLADTHKPEDLMLTKEWKSLVENIKKYVNFTAKDSNFVVSQLKLISNSAYHLITKLPVSSGLNGEETIFVKMYGPKGLASPEYAEDNKKYNASTDKVLSYAKNIIKWNPDPDGAWVHFIKPGKRINEHTSFKQYRTLKTRNTDNMEKIVPKILKDLNDLNSDNEIQLKFPEKWGAFLQHIDSIVIHYKDKNLEKPIEDILAKYSSSFANRDNYKRSSIGVDSTTDTNGNRSHGSDSSIIGEKFAKNVQSNKDVFKTWFETQGDEKTSKKLYDMLRVLQEKSTHRNVP